MLPEAHVHHVIPNRIRIKIPSRKGDHGYFSTVSQQLANCAGVEEVWTNPSTAGLLVIHHCELKDLAVYAEENSLFHLIRPKGAARKTLFQNVSDAFRTYDVEMKTMTNGVLDIPSMVFLSLVVSGLWQIARGNLVMPAWYVAFYYALGVYMHSKEGDPDEGGNILEESGECDMGGTVE